MAKLTFRGEPYVVDIVLRPVLSGTRWVLGVALGALLWWLDLVLWVPVPVVLATIAMETWLALRSDRPVRIDVDDERLVVDDRFAATLTVFRKSVTACTVLHQPRPHGGTPGHEVVLTLADERRIVLAVALQLDALPSLPDTAVDVAAMDAWLGAQAGLLRALASPTRIVRQRVHQAGLLQAVRAWLPEGADQRAVRVWSGPDPELSPFGLHEGEPLGLLLLGERTWQLTTGDGTRRGPRTVVDWSVSQRQAALFGVEGKEEVAPGLLPLLLLTLASEEGDPLVVAIPAPARGGPDRPDPPDAALHTHAPEGAVLLSWLAEAGQLPSDLTPPDEPPPDGGDTPLPAPGAPVR